MARFAPFFFLTLCFPTCAIKEVLPCFRRIHPLLCLRAQTHLCYCGSGSLGPSLASGNPFPFQFSPCPPAPNSFFCACAPDRARRMIRLSLRLCLQILDPYIRGPTRFLFEFVAKGKSHAQTHLLSPPALQLVLFSCCNPLFLFDKVPACIPLTLGVCLVSFSQVC